MPLCNGHYDTTRSFVNHATNRIDSAVRLPDGSRKRCFRAGLSQPCNARHRAVPRWWRLGSYGQDHRQKVIHVIAPPNLKTEEVRQLFADQGAQIVGAGPKEFAAYIDLELKKWARVVADAKIRLESN